MTKQPLLTKLNLQFFADSAAEIAVEIQKEVKNLREMNERSLKEQETKFDGATQETKNAIDGANARIDELQKKLDAAIYFLVEPKDSLLNVATSNQIVS